MHRDLAKSIMRYIRMVIIIIIIQIYPGGKNNKIQRNLELWDQENDFVISGFCYISVLYNESPMYS